MSCRIYIEPDRLAAGQLDIDGDEHHYLHRVRRARPGDEVTAFDGAGRRAAARIERIASKTTTLSLAEPEQVPAPNPAIRVLLPLMKGDAFDSCTSKLVELGVTTIVPVRTRRCVVKIAPDKAEARQARFQSRAVAAARQSRNPYVPAVEAIADLQPACEACSETLRLVPWERADGSLAEALAGGAPGSIAVLFGPEGGLEEGEVEAARAAGFAPVSLGPRILRAETAPIATVAILRFTFGDLR